LPWWSSFSILKADCRLHANVDAAAAEVEAGIDLRRLHRRQICCVNDKLLRRVRLCAAALVLPGERLIAQRELQAVVGGSQPCLLKRAFELWLLALQKRERLGPVDGDVRRHLTAGVDAKPHIDPAELGRVEPDVELVGSGLRARRDGDWQAGNRNRSRLC
jgi:hypothetical protein